MPKIAIVCDWLTNYGGAERVIENLSNMYPDAPIYTSIFNKKALPSFVHKKIITSFINQLPFAKNNHRPYLKLMPYAFEEFNLSDFDIVISSSHSCAKGVITKPQTLHISYCHNPMRYVWDDFHSYLNHQRIHRSLKSWLYYYLSDIRIWDRLAADRVDYFIANSKCVSDRIKKYYRRESEVIYPPCDINRFTISSKNGDYFLALGRLVAYKRFDLVLEVFNQLQLPLKIVGSGSELKHLKSNANKNIEFLGQVRDDELNQIYGNAKALIFPQYEDFGLIPLESMACGRPVIAYAYGGALETIINGKTGVFFFEQTVDSLKKAINSFLETKFDPCAIRLHTRKFDKTHFEKKITNFINKKWQSWS